MKRVLSIIIVACIISGCLLPFAQAIDAQGVDYSTPSHQTTPTCGIVSISAGVDMSAAVMDNGSLYTWGCADLRQWVSGGTSGAWYDYRLKTLGLAVGSCIEGVPTMVLNNSVKSVNCSSNKATKCFSVNVGMYCPMTAILKDDSTLWIWGSNGHGALGTGEESTVSWKPVQLLENVVSYDVSGLHSAAVTADGSLYVWGYNNHGQLGNGTTEDVMEPTKVLDGASQVALGYNFTVVLKTDGSVWTAGSNNYGQLGAGTDAGEERSTFSQVLTNVSVIAAGQDFAAAIKTDGSLWVWGRNIYGQLGLGDISNRFTPTKNPNLENVESISLGNEFSGAITSDGALWMWGSNSTGQLGDGSTVNLTTPLIILRDVKQVSLGKSHTLALKNDGTLWAWGLNSAAQLGDGTKKNRNCPTEVQFGVVNADFFVSDGNTQQLSVSWDDAALFKPSIEYSETLAEAGIILSQAAYNRSQIAEQFGFNVIRSGIGNDSIDAPGYIIGYRVTYDFGDPHMEIMMAIRGTKSLVSWDAINDLKAIADGFEGPTQYCYSELKAAKSAISSALSNNGLSVTKSNTRFFITGHSLGGACAGKLALKMANDGFAYPNNIYVYTYGTPNFTNVYEKLDSYVDVPGMVHHVNLADVVPDIPHGFFRFVFFYTTLHKAGTTRYYSHLVNESSFKSVIYGLNNGELPWDTYTPLKQHMLQNYLALLRTNCYVTASSHYIRPYRMIKACCPVEVEVYDASGNLCAETENGMVSYPNPSAVRILIEEDHKYIELPTEGDFTLRYIGTDAGTMELIDQILDPESGEVESEKVFENIALKKGKIFFSEVAGDAEQADLELFVSNAAGTPVASVDTDGTETAINSNPFLDIAEGKYYYIPVLWAYYHEPQITSGTDTTHFSPKKNCTREQIVTFLYAAYGKPAHHVTENPFSDVKKKYYYNAVMWAYENGITDGIGGGKFGVGKPCMREQIVTFLWTAAGRPKPTITECPFTDVKHKYYYTAVLWAYENGITGGVGGGRFGVGSPCTRAQVVTFLYKAVGQGV